MTRTLLYASDYTYTLVAATATRDTPDIASGLRSNLKHQALQ